MRKSQTATEYLIILAVVIVIALVVVNTMGGFPGIGAGSGKKVSDFKLAQDTVGIESYNIGASFSLFKLKNNYYDTVTVTSFKVNDQNNLTCNSSNTNPALPIVLNVGQSMLINCSVVNSSTYTLSNRQTPMVGITYVDNIGATRTAGNEGSSVAVSQDQVSPPVTPSYTITFDANTGAGTMSTQTIEEGSSANLTPNNFTKESNTFNGWSTLANGNGLNYSDNVSYTMGAANVTLYAKWTEVVVDACGTSGNATDPDCWSDEASNTAYGPMGTNTAASESTVLSNGKNNTAELYALGSSYVAAYYCYTLDEGSVPPGNWYLPSYAELSDGWTALGSGGFPSDFYWSSTEYSGNPEGLAWYLYTSYGGMDSYYKDGPGSVRCLR